MMSHPASCFAARLLSSLSAGCFASQLDWSGRFDRFCLCRKNQTGTDTAYFLLYVDDIVLTASSETLLQQIISSLHQEFSMTDLGSLNYFLGISVTRDSSKMFLSQRKYAIEILERATMVSCISSMTPVNT
ncbi:ribonuclease H-like domain-containing protein [Tanacetum coccineum]